AVRVVPAQIGPNLVCGDDLCVLRRGASRLVRGDGERGQVLGADARHIVLRDTPTWQPTYPTPTPRRLPRRHRPVVRIPSFAGSNRGPQCRTLHGARGLLGRSEVADALGSGPGSLSRLGSFGSPCGRCMAPWQGAE